MQLSVGAGLFDSAHVGDERKSPKSAVRAPAETSGDDGAESIGSNCQPSPDGPTLTACVADECAGHAPAIVQQFLDSGALQHRGARPASGAEQLVVEHPARDCQALGTKRSMPGPLEHA